MLWAVIFMFHSIWRQFSMFEFWRISWHSPFNAFYSAMKIFLPCVVTTVFSFPVLALLQPHRWTFQLLYSPTVQLKLRFLSTQVCGNKELLTLKAPISTCIFSTLRLIHFLWYCLIEFVQTSRHIIFVVHVINSHDLYVLQKLDARNLEVEGLKSQR